jgi:hypothetical protein
MQSQKEPIKQDDETECEAEEKRSYYYDDAHGYEDFDPENEDEEPEGED